MNLTPKKLVKALRICSKRTENACIGCPCLTYYRCRQIIKQEAADLIESQQKELAEKTETIRMLAGVTEQEDTP